ncbi:hypothetical protein BRARA_A01982 [Brassica rapa]|uniref:Pyruvate, phosphate dikinase n=1 Tax=Brassica campestris TaxID=3711 RepID=A0A398AV45_BRACM|nr:hypothetical protein BRARA_A01982 [Brassica rapa]
MKSMILKTTLELFKGDGVYWTDHLDRSRLASRSYRLSNGSNRVSRIGTIHCKRLSITKTGMHGGTKARAVLSPVSDPAASLTKKRVFTFGKGRSEGNKGMKSLLGGKGANLAEMASIGLSVPPGLTISTEACQQYQVAGKKLPEGLWEEILEGLSFIERDIGASLADPSKPLLLSVRSGAAISMPGMMDTVLNLGLNDQVVVGLAAKSGERFAYDSFRRFLDMFGDVVLGIPHAKFEEKLERMKESKGVKNDTELSAEDLKELVEQYKSIYLQVKGQEFPSDPKKQLELAIEAVFDSWDSPRAIKYRSINQISGLKGTAVNIQCMVFGNMGDTSGTGVLFTRNPSTGEKKLYGEFLVNAQGEDVLTEMQARAIFEAAASMQDQGVTVLPEIMVPLVGTPQELGHQVDVIRKVAKKVFVEKGHTVTYKVGTMIEIPRAALIADEIAEQAEFFSFGTNDLTQMTFGYSRDDVAKFLPMYLAKGILQHDPFEVLDQKGVGQLVKMATERGRAARPNLKVGVCGEHGGEPSSVAFFAEAGLDYVSCSPFRVPIARLAAAQVVIA